MHLFRNLAELDSLGKPLSLALGVFDGVHLGHQAVIKEAGKRARDVQGISAVVTFHPHPIKVLNPKAAPALLTTEQQDYELFSRLDVDACLVIDFTEEFSRCSAHQFLEMLIQNASQLKSIVVGPNWHFGRDREGDFKLLQTWGEANNIKAVEVEPVCVDDEIVSSTLIRKLISEGHIEAANVRLDRSYQIVGKVVQGNGLGHKIGFPTANLDVESELLPKQGVYAARALCEGEVFVAVVNIGRKPTLFRKSPIVVEAHLLDFDGDIYNHHVRLDFVAHIRDEKKFKNVDELRNQIISDIDTVWELLGT